ncbi:MAG TPA: ABC transporter, partial [Micromonosporaceae bacterium]|nr:ABC transporter [Micromonosporaceae bacterium]
MLRAVLRDMRAHLGRVAMTMVAIVLGVAFVVATWVVSDSAAETIANGSSRSDLAVQVTANGPDAKLTAADREKLAALPGVRRATGVVIGHAAVVQSNGKLGDTYYPPEGGTSWDNSDRFALVSGRGPAASGEVALEEEVAKDAGLAVGATARMLKEDGTSESATVVGIFTYRKAGVHEGTPAVAYDQATAMRILGESFARVELFGADQTRLADAAKTAMGADFAVETGAELAADRKARAEEDAKMMRNFLLAFAGVALLAGMFVIANTFTMLVAQRTRHFALLRAVGAKRRQVRRAVLVEAAVLGLLGATIGSAIGVGMGWLTMRWLRTTGETVVFAVSPLAI